MSSAIPEWLAWPLILAAFVVPMFLVYFAARRWL